MPAMAQAQPGCAKTAQAESLRPQMAQGEAGRPHMAQAEAHGAPQQVARVADPCK
jgi:hypothetical protein